MDLTPDQFAKSLIAAGISSAEEIKTFWNALPAGTRPKSGAALAHLLVEQRKLTSFQAEVILSRSQTPLVLGDYLLLAKIGAGGMGQVFKAQHRHMKRQVAIKLLPTALTSDEAAIKRFQREVEAAAKLVHPNIVQAYDASVQRRIWYLVMEYVEGRDLAAVVATEGPLSIERAVEYVRQAATGLAFAHSSGVVHRDVKPANLLLDKTGLVKILDLGLARFEDNVPAAQEALTGSGIVMGTVDFMAPEQAFDTRAADARADIYSQQNPIPALVKVRSDVPIELATIYERMVAKKPGDRYQAMTDVSAALRTLALQRREEVPLKGVTGDEGGVETSANVFSPEAVELAIANPAQEIAATVSLQSPLESTDPVSERSIQIARGSSGRNVDRQRPPAWTRNRFVLLGGVCGSLLVLALGIGGWFLSNQPAPVNVPPGGAAKVVSDGPSTNRGPQNPSPEPVVQAEPLTGWIDLLTRIDPALDTVQIAGRTGKNQWSLVAARFSNCLRIRTNGFNCDLPGARGIVPMMIDVGSGQVLMGRSFLVIASPCRIETGKRMKLRISKTVVSSSDRIEVRVNDQFIGAWTGDWNSQVWLSNDEVPAADMAGLFVHPQADFTFHALRLKMIRGDAIPTRKEPK